MSDELCPPGVRRLFSTMQTRRVGIMAPQLVPVPGTWYLSIVRVIARKTLRTFWERHPDARDALIAWFREAELATWAGPQDIKVRYPSASFIAGDRVVFNVRGNKYRLIVAVRYPLRLVFIRFVGTHSEYDKVDAEKV